MHRAPVFCAANGFVEQIYEEQMRSLILPILVGALSVNFLIYQAKDEDARVAEVQQSVQTLETLVKVDQSRRSAREKVNAIIQRFNPAMAPEMRLKLADEIYAASVRYPNLDVDLICATITHESARTWNPRVVSRAGAMGLMQIMPNTGKWLARYEGIPFKSPERVLFDPVANVKLGTRYLSALIESYDLEGGLAAYNGGAKRARMWLSRNKADGILWAETRDYIPNVLKLYDEFRSERM